MSWFRATGATVICLSITLAAMPAVSLRAQQTTPPPPGRARPVNLPKITERQLANGLTVILAPLANVPKITAQLTVRVGQATDYEKLTLEVWTNGTISPEMALVEASKILRKHLNPFVQYFELGSDTASDDAIQSMRDASKATMDPELEQKLSMTVQELDLSVRIWRRFGDQLRLDGVDPGLGKCRDEKERNQDDQAAQHGDAR